MIELPNGDWIAPEHCTFIKKASDNECVVFTVGQSALEGHVQPYAAEEVAEVINDALEGIEYEDEDEPDEHAKEENDED